MTIRKRIKQIYIAWLTMLSVLFVSFAPAVSAMHEAQAGSTQWVLLCTSAGITKVPWGDPAKKHDTQVKHCPWCHLTHQPLLPAYSQPWQTLEQNAADVIISSSIVASNKFDWLLPPAQGPPLLI